MFKVALCLLEHMNDELLALQGVEKLLRYIQRGAHSLVVAHPGQVIADAMALPITPTLLEQLRKEFDEMKMKMAEELMQPPMPAGKGLNATEAVRLWDRLKVALRRGKLLEAQVDRTMQRVNHAKSALQSHRVDYISVRTECEDLRAENERLRARITELEEAAATAAAEAAATEAAAAKAAEASVSALGQTKDSMATISPTELRANSRSEC